MKRLFATALLAGAYSLSLLAGPSFASGESPTGDATTASSAGLSRATETLRDGDDVRARFIVTVRSALFEEGALVLSPSPATSALADGDDIRARFIMAVQH
jgi:hypothetical protein